MPVSRKPPGIVRIVGGRWKRSALEVVDAPGLRPTPGRVRETVFNWLAHALGSLDGRTVLDLYAGSGALGFEAASRGAARSVLVDNRREVVDRLRASKARLAADAVEVVAGDALAVGGRLRDAGSRFDVVFLDPPFGEDRLPPALALAGHLSADEGLVYVETDAPLGDAAAGGAGYAPYRADRAGDVFYYLLQRKIRQNEET